MSIQESTLGMQGFARGRVAIAVSLALGAAAAAHAQNAPQNPSAEEAKTLPKVSVAAPEEETINVQRASSPKATADLVNTPQTIAVVTSEVLHQQGATNLSQALRNTPGVTFLLGENGNTATGDSIFMRGFDTQGSIFIDGIRDLGTVSRDTFNTDQVEIAKGPAGPDYGRSAASGYVNLVSKVPAAESFASGTASYGTASNGRVTGDFNHGFEGSGSAVRINVMGQDSEVEGRDFIERQGWSVAPSLAFGLGGDTRSYFYLLHTEQDNTPDGGVSTLGLPGFYDLAFDQANPMAPARGIDPAPVDSSNFYGSAQDFEQIKGTMFTARIEHDFNEHFTLRNTSRYGKLRQFYQLTGLNAFVIPSASPDSWTQARTRHTKFQENTLLTNQTNLSATFATGSVGHSLTTGFEFIDEEQFNPGYAGAGTMPNANLYAPNRNDPITGYSLARNGLYTRGETQTIGVYVFDTLSFTDRWQVTGGLRFDSFDTDFSSVVASTATTHPTLPVGTPVPLALEVDDTLFSYKLGVVFKPAESGSIYLSTATSEQPPGGANFTLSATPGNANNAGLKPTKGINLELGTKWDLKGGAYSVTAALFRSSNENEVIPDSVDPNLFVQVGERRVEGIELGVIGNLTESWQLSAGLAKMDSEIVRGSGTQQGQAINWSPELTFTSWTTYKLPGGLTIGGGARYVDTVSRAINNTLTPGNAPLLSAPEYWVVDAMVTYSLNEKVSFQLNGYNLLDEEYLASLNNSGRRYLPGTQRSGLLTVNFQF